MKKLWDQLGSVLIVGLIPTLVGYGALQMQVTQANEVAKAAVPRTEFAQVLTRLDEIRADIRELRQEVRRK